VSEYFYLLDKTNRQQNEPLPPVVRQLKGLLKGSGLDEADYKKYLENKYL
jgi:hypothetical protein